MTATNGSGADNPPPASPAPSGPLSEPVQYVRSIGPAAAKSLAKIGIVTIGDLLRHVPRRYEDRRAFRRIADLQPGEPATIEGRVVDAQTAPTSRRNFSLTRVLVSDNTSVVQLVFFQQPYLQRQFEQMARARRHVVVYGTPRRSMSGPLEMDRAEWEEVSEEADPLSTGRIVPVYPATEGITQRRLRRAVDAVLATHLQHVPDALPPPLVKRLALIDARTAYRDLHFPADSEGLAAARRRLVMEEFLLLQVGLARRRLAHARTRGSHVMRVDAARLRADLGAVVPFELTGAQRRAIDQIAADLAGGHCMNRLVQGDVGSGKTVVALAAMLMAVQSDYQAALMAPTEILAQQHAIVLRRMLEPLGVGVELAIGSQGARARDTARTNLANGQSAIAVGTHALIQEGVAFRRLGLAIIDEQHRFGVLQRQALHRKGDTPHVLVMTATPIPRTLTLTLYGDLEVSVIDELPPGRRPIKTHWKPRSEAGSVYAAAATLIRQGRQVYVVCPLVEESEKLQVKAATQLAEHIATDVLPQHRVGLLHGQMRTEEKDDVMRRFKAGDLDVLVATTVIEVGIDVPNATVIIIEDADRFGLAQLHQLRGRVGRGEHASYCVLLADPRTDEGRARLQALTETTDGFRIAEEDLRLRGPGEFLGTRQSGLPELTFGDLLGDIGIMEEARRAAHDVVSADPNLARPEHAALRQALETHRLGFELIHVS